MVVHSSSEDLHPRTGARFTFERTDDSSPGVYRVWVYLADGRTICGTLSWPQGRATFEDAAEGDDEPLRWARDEALKLARAVKASQAARLTRWRG